MHDDQVSNHFYCNECKGYHGSSLSECGAIGTFAKLKSALIEYNQEMDFSNWLLELTDSERFTILQLHSKGKMKMGSMVSRPFSFEEVLEQQKKDGTYQVMSADETVDDPVAFKNEMREFRNKSRCVDLSEGKFKYWVIGTYQDGRKFPVPITINPANLCTDWMYATRQACQEAIDESSIRKMPEVEPKDRTRISNGTRLDEIPPPPAPPPDVIVDELRGTYRVGEKPPPFWWEFWKK